MEAVRGSNEYWEGVREQYVAFESGISAQHLMYIYIKCQVANLQT